jgi:hypothetical protein
VERTCVSTNHFPMRTLCECETSCPPSPTFPRSQVSAPARFLILQLFAFVLLVFCGPTAAAAEPPFSYTDYSEVLKAYVSERGLVNYRELKAHRGRLDRFVDSLSTLNGKVYDTWSENERIAFWINAYNALTLKAIIDNYPIKASIFRSLRFPSNSIRQIAGVWDELTFNVMRSGMTLDQIEHKTLRAKFHEPRIHMALVCAAMGCPILRNVPYLAEKLDAQLNDQANRFLGNPDKFRIDRSAGTVYLSSIFKWFGQDFENQFGTTEKLSRFQGPERSVLNFVSGYLNPEDRTYLETGVFSIDYLKYDWSLNELSS